MEGGGEYSCTGVVFGGFQRYREVLRQRESESSLEVG